MTNREWLFEEMKNMSDEELIKFDISQFICNSIKNSECENWDGGCIDCKINWLKSEHKEKIKLSEAERIILENIDKDYKWIARDGNTELYVFESEPNRDARLKQWGTCRNDCINITPFNHLFQFITWNDSEPYNIAELLKGG